MVKHFVTKQKSKSITLCHCVWLRWFFLIVWFTLTLNPKLLCGMYGLTAKSSVARLNICQILMRSHLMSSLNLGNLPRLLHLNTPNLHYIVISTFVIVTKVSLQNVSLPTGWWTELNYKKNICTYKIHSKSISRMSAHGVSKKAKDIESFYLIPLQF